MGRRAERLEILPEVLTTWILYMPFGFGDSATRLSNYLEGLYLGSKQMIRLEGHTVIFVSFPTENNLSASANIPRKKK